MSQYECGDCGLLESGEVNRIEGLSGTCDHCGGHVSRAFGRR